MNNTIRTFSALLVATVGLAAFGAADAQDVTLPEGSTMPFEELNCPNASVFGPKMMTSVCWECMFPIRIAGASIAGGGHKAPSGAANTGFCYCPGCGLVGKFGVTVGYWSPSRLIEQVTQPMCFPGLGGVTMGDYSPFVDKIQIGRQGGGIRDGAQNHPGLSHFHYYSYPILAILGMMDTYDCVDDGISDFDLLWASEAVFPNWTDDSLSIFLNPEANLFANVASFLVQPVDCITSTINYRPIDSMFWIAGCWGSMYPLTGYTPGGTASPIQAASLRTSRSLFLLHRIGMAKRQGGNDAVCKPVREPIMSKSFYRQQQFWPMPESGGRMPGNVGEGSAAAPFGFGSMLPTCCHSIGASSMAWGEWRRGVPVTEEGANIQLAWRWVDCCVGVCI